MGISRAGRFSRKRTGGRRKQARKKRAYEKARPASQTKLAPKRVRLVRVRGGKYKLRALRLRSGNFSWRSEQCGAKTRIVDVVYHPANAEYVRTKTLTKSAIVSIDATPFRVWYRNHYNTDLHDGEEKALPFKKSVSKDERKKIEKLREDQFLPQNILEQFEGGRLLAIVTSSPGQVGRADGYILEEEELDFYLRKIRERKKGKKAKQQ